MRSTNGCGEIFEFMKRKLHFAGRMALLISLAVLAASCALPATKTKGTAGLSKTQIAVLKEGNDLYIRAIDGQGVKFSLWRDISPGVRLAPGPHNVTVFFYGNAVQSVNDVTLYLNALSGHIYLLDYGPTQGPMGWNLIIRDITDKTP
jgi:hypothetical protein